MLRGKVLPVVGKVLKVSQSKLTPQVLIFFLPASELFSSKSPRATFNDLPLYYINKGRIQKARVECLKSW